MTKRIVSALLAFIALVAIPSHVAFAQGGGGPPSAGQWYVPDGGQATVVGNNQGARNYRIGFSGGSDDHITIIVTDGSQVTEYTLSGDSTIDVGVPQGADMAIHDSDPSTNPYPASGWYDDI